MNVGDGTRVRYLELRPLLERLKDEAIYSLRESLAKRGIPIHDVVGRVKEFDSFIDKVKRKGYDNPFDQSPDLVGVRVVSLFLSNLPKVREAIVEVFEILEEDDKVIGDDPASFGYMSTHFRCKIGSRANGPRYDPIKDFHFEVQSRTIGMDAWANVSHHLSYKGNASIPPELRRSFHALSGLFYIADQHFELFAVHAQKSEADAATNVAEGDLASIPVNADTLLAFVRSRYPNRGGTDKAGVSELAEQLLRGGYTDLEALTEALDRGEPAALQLGSLHDLLVDVGVVRRALCAIDEAFDELVTEDARRDFLGLHEPPDAAPPEQ